MNLNKVLLVGNLTSDVTLRSTPTGQSVATFGLATNRFYKDKTGARQQQAEFHSIVVWGKQAEACSQYVKKGDIILVEGRIQSRKYTDKQDQERKVTEIVAEGIQFGPRKDTVNTFKPASESQETPDREPIINLDADPDNVEDLPF